jgi:hypothetical protein
MAVVHHLCKTIRSRYGKRLDRHEILRRNRSVCVVRLGFAILSIYGIIVRNARGVTGCTVCESGGDCVDQMCLKST